MAVENERENLLHSQNQLLTIIEAAQFLRIRASIFRLIKIGIIQTIKLTPRMTRISMSELLRLASANGYEVVTDDTSSFPSVHDIREKNKGAADAPETGLHRRISPF